MPAGWKRNWAARGCATVACIGVSAHLIGAAVVGVETVWIVVAIIGAASWAGLAAMFVFDSDPI